MATDATTSDEKRIIKRYSNRKLYDTKDSRYVTLQQIGEMVRRGEDVQIIDNKTKEDKTEVTLALIISEDLKNKPSSVPLGTLRSLIQERGERLLSTLRDGPIGRLIPGGEEGAEPSEPGASQPGASQPGASQPGPSQPGPSQPGAQPAAAVSDDEAAKKGRIDELVEQSRHTLDQLQATLDDRVAAIVPGVGSIRELRAAVEELDQRLAVIENKLGIERAGDDETSS